MSEKVLPSRMLFAARADQSRCESDVPVPVGPLQEPEEFVAPARGGTRDRGHLLRRPAATVEEVERGHVVVVLHEPVERFMEVFPGPPLPARSGAAVP